MPTTLFVENLFVSSFPIIFDADVVISIVNSETHQSLKFCFNYTKREISIYDSFDFNKEYEIRYYSTKKEKKYIRKEKLKRLGYG